MLPKSLQGFAQTIHVHLILAKQAEEVIHLVSEDGLLSFESKQALGKCLKPPCLKQRFARKAHKPFEGKGIDPNDSLGRFGKLFVGFGFSGGFLDRLYGFGRSRVDNRFRFGWRYRLRSWGHLASCKFGNFRKDISRP